MPRTKGQKTLYMERKEKGLCVSCGQKHERTTAYCKSCTQKVIEYDRKRIEKGMCLRCRAVLPVEGKKHCQRCLDFMNRPEEVERKKVYRRGIRKEVIEGYGGKCTCCGEANLGFLSLDHVNNDGKAHREEVGAAIQTVFWARKNGYPNNLTVLCYNCNLGRQFNGGVCPHKTGGLEYAAV